MAFVQPKGESEITKTSTETNVLIPWRITQRIGIVCVVVVLCLYLTIWGVWWMSSGRDWEPVLRHLAQWWLAWILPLLFAFVFPFIGLVVYDYLPRLRNANWPPPWAQVEPGVGFFDAYTMPVDEEQDVEPIPWILQADYKDENGKLWRERLTTEYAWEWHRYAKALTNRAIWLRPNFSFRAAKRVAGIPSEEFDRLCNQWLARGYVYRRPTPNGNAKTEIKAMGRVWLRMMATTPPPQA